MSNKSIFIPLPLLSVENHSKVNVCYSERVKNIKSGFNYSHVVQLSGSASLYETWSKWNYLVISKAIV